MDLSQGEGCIQKVVALLQPRWVKARHSAKDKSFTKTNWDVKENK